MGHRRLACLLLIVFWAFPIGSSPAEDQPPMVEDKRPYTLTVGVREWLSHGQSAHNLGAPSGGHPNVLSELTWRGMNSSITELNANLIAQRLLLNMSVGYGTIGSGTLLDQDWNGDNRTQKYSETLSKSDNGSVLIFSVTPGIRAFQWTVKDNPILGGFDFLLGYQYWRETYAAYGIQDIFPGGRDTPSSVNVLTQTNTWQSFRFGTRVVVPVLSQFLLKGSAFYIPVTYYRSEDFHHLRTSGLNPLRQDPSFLTTASGGSGVQLEGSLAVRVWHQLTIEAGYAYWDIRSGSGTVQAYPASGGVIQELHNVNNTRRQGVFFGMNWIF
jgi:hypothetical protein